MKHWHDPWEDTAVMHKKRAEERMRAVRESTVEQKLHLLNQIFGPPPVELCLTETICQAGIEVSE